MATRQRILTALLLPLTMLLLLWYVGAFSSDLRSSVSPTDPFISTSTLNLSIAQIVIDPPTVRVGITNLHPSTTVDLLVWDTPLDEDALAIGVFNIKEAATGHSLTQSSIRPERQQLPPKEAIWMLEPRHTVTRDIVLPVADGKAFDQTLRLERGQVYHLMAKCHWKAVWYANVVGVEDGSLKKSGGSTGFWNGKFESGPVEIRVP